MRKGVQGRLQSIDSSVSSGVCLVVIVFIFACEGGVSVAEAEEQAGCSAETYHQPTAQESQPKQGHGASLSNMPRGGSVELVPASSLFVSEPNPAWFGNPSNPKRDSRWTNENWLKSRFHFSFAEYHDRNRRSFGVLRVMNDDLVQPNRGFGTHPHANMEICTYVVKGKLTHKDSMGTEETLSKGAIQFMTAGTGVRHSERNKDKHNPLRFIQMWIVPRAEALPPNYGSAAGDGKARHNKLAHIVADVEDASAEGVLVRINQDANIFAAELDKDKSVQYQLRAGRQAYFLCLEGEVNVFNSTDQMGSDAVEPFHLLQHDAAKLFGEATFTFAATSSSSTHFLFVEMKQ